MNYESDGYDDHQSPAWNLARYAYENQITIMTASGFTRALRSFERENKAMLDGLGNPAIDHDECVNLYHEFNREEFLYSNEEDNYD